MKPTTLATEIIHLYYGWYQHGIANYVNFTGAIAAQNMLALTFKPSLARFDLFPVELVDSGKN